MVGIHESILTNVLFAVGISNLAIEFPHLFVGGLNEFAIVGFTEVWNFGIQVNSFNVTCDSYLFAVVNCVTIQMNGGFSISRGGRVGPAFTVFVNNPPPAPTTTTSQRTSFGFHLVSTQWQHAIPAAKKANLPSPKTKMCASQLQP